MLCCIDWLTVKVSNLTDLSTLTFVSSQLFLRWFIAPIHQVSVFPSIKSIIQKF